MKKEKFIPEVKSTLRSRSIEIPKSIYKASGITILGKRIKSLLFTTDIAIIKNSNASSIMAVYPFTPQLSITQAIIENSPVPVFAGVGGGLTTGQRSISIAIQAELIGAYGVVVNAPATNEVIKEMSDIVDIPVIATVASIHDDFIGKKEAGAKIFNVSAGSNTYKVVEKLRSELGYKFPIIATGGPTDETILQTIEAGANAITYTPPTSAEIFAGVMQKYRVDKKQ